MANRKDGYVMNLSMLRQAVGMYESRGDHDIQTQADIANFWIELAEMEKAAPDREYCKDVTVIPTTLMLDFGNIMWYDYFGRKARQVGYDNMTAEEFINTVHHDAYCQEVSDLVLTDSYYLIRDIWLENENGDDNNQDGSFKQPTKLTVGEREIIRDLICNYRDSLAGCHDDNFDAMQSILAKLR